MLMVSGKLKAYTNENEKDLTQNIVELSAQESIVLCTHCVMFTVPADAVTNQSYIKNLLHFISEAESNGIAYLLLITRVDLEEPSLRNFPEQLETSQCVKKLCQQLSEKTGVPDMDIFPVLAYTKEESKDKFIEMSVLRMVQKALEKSEDWLYMQDMKFGDTQETVKPQKSKIIL